MKKIKSKIIEFLTKDVENENDSNDLAILIRVLSILCAIHYLVMIFPVAYTGNIWMTLLLIFLLGLLLGVFVCTYERRTKTALWLFNHSIMFTTIVLSARLGWGYFFAPIMFTAVLLVFFCIKIPIREKLIYSLFCGLVFIVLIIGHLFIPLRTAPPLIIKMILTGINVSLSFSGLTTVAYAFYLKYTRSEEKIIQYNKRLEQLVNTDALTTLWNRRAMNEHLATLMNNYNKYQSDFSVAILDIDFFKKVNDEYGHGMGDFVLKSLSYLAKTHMDGKGHVARWGGEEFLLTFEGMDYDEAIGILEELRVKIEEQEFAMKDIKLHLTITAGIEEFHSGLDLDQIITNADEKLYTGKMSGRNQIVSAYYNA